MRSGRSFPNPLPPHIYFTPSLKGARSWKLSPRKKPTVSSVAQSAPRQRFLRRSSISRICGDPSSLRTSLENITQSWISYALPCLLFLDLSRRGAHLIDHHASAHVRRPVELRRALCRVGGGAQRFSLGPWRVAQTRSTFTAVLAVESSACKKQKQACCGDLFAVLP